MILIPLGWKIVACLPAFFLRWFLKPQRLATKLKIDLLANEPGEFTTDGAVPQLRLWFTVRNWSPFSVTLDRMTLQICAGPLVAMAVSVDRVDIPAYTELNKPHVVTLLSESQVAYLRSQDLDGDRLELSIYSTAYFSSKIGWVTVTEHIEREAFPCRL